MLQLIAGAKNRAKAKQLPFNITKEYLEYLWREQEGLCCVTGESFDLRAPNKKFECRWNAPSLDRIVPELGYVEGNVRLVCYQVNMAIAAYGLKHFINLCEKVQRYQGGFPG